MATAIERGFIPLPKVERDQPIDNIRIHLKLPDYLDQDRIGVNLADISKLCKLTGIRQLVVLGIAGEETSKVIPEIAGQNPDGSAVASKKIAKVTAPTFQVHLNNPNYREISIATRSVGLIVHVNTDEIALRVSEAPKGVHSVENWVKHLDNGFKEPIRRVGGKNLLFPLEIYDITTNATLGSYAAASVFASILEGGLPLFPAQLILGTCLLATFKGVEAFHESSNPNFRFSPFPGPQFERALALAIKSRTTTLIKDIGEDKKHTQKP